MAMGLKCIETRSWWTSHRGNLAIHAAKKWNRELEEFAERMGVGLDLPLGAIVAVGQLVKIDRTDLLRPTISEQEERWGNYENGRYGWIFANIKALPEPVPFRGAQGLFDVPNSLLGDLAPPPRQRPLI
jgi:hypothetical protein